MKVLLGLLLAAGASSAIAQVVPRPEPMEAPPVPMAPPARLDLRLTPEPVQALVLPAPVLVKAFRFSGLRAVAEAELANVVAGWTGRVLSAADFNQATHAVAEHLRAKGFLVASAYVPQQEIRDGVVEIAVLEGRLGAVRLDVAQQAGLKRDAADRFLRGIQSDDPIRDDNVQQALLLLNDVPGVRVEADLTTGARPGSADLNVRVLGEAPFSGTLVLDNASERNVGESRADARLRWNSPLGLGDLLILRWLQSSGAGKTYGSVTYGLPVNDLGTRVGLRYGEQRYELRKEFTPLRANGEQSAVSFLVNHPILRRNDRNLAFGFTHALYGAEDRFDAVGLRSDARHRISTLSLTYDSRDQWWGGGVNVLQVQILAGHASQRVPELAAIDAGPGGLNVYGSFGVYRFLAAREQVLGERTSLRAVVFGQTASRNLSHTGPAELELGGPNAVRAYPVGELYADQGYVARLELRRAFALSEGSRTVVAAFHDQARAALNRHPFPGDPDNRRGLSAWGLGVTHDQGGHLSFESWLAWRGSEKPVTAPDRKPRVWVSLTTRF